VGTLVPGSILGINIGSHTISGGREDGCCASCITVHGGRCGGGRSDGGASVCGGVGGGGGGVTGVVVMFVGDVGVVNVVVR
jgi:hypothetical protein